MATLDSTLSSFVGNGRALDADAIAARATSFWNSAPMQAKAMLLPSSADEVAQILGHCNSSGQSVITQGGLTNCVTAAEPGLDDVVISTEKMASVVEIDTNGIRRSI